MKQQEAFRYKTYRHYEQIQPSGRPDLLVSYLEIGVYRKNIVSAKTVYSHFETLRRIHPVLRIPKPLFAARIKLAEVNARGKKNRLNTKQATGRSF